MSIDDALYDRMGNPSYLSNWKVAQLMYFYGEIQRDYEEMYWTSIRAREKEKDGDLEGHYAKVLARRILSNMEELKKNLPEQAQEALIRSWVRDKNLFTTIEKGCSKIQEEFKER